MAERIQVADLAKPDRLRVQSAPIDTFIQPALDNVADPGTNVLSQLSDALDAFEPGAKRTLNAMQKAFIDAEIASAQQARITNQLTFAEAVKEGKIDGGMSPWWTKEYHRLDGEVAFTMEYPAVLEQAIAESGIAQQDFDNEAEAGRAYEELVGKTRAEFLKGKNPQSNPDFFAGAEGARGGVESAANSRFLQDRIAGNEARFAAGVQFEIGSVMSDDTLSSDAKTRQIRRINTEKRMKYGFTNKQYNKAMLDATTAQALARAERGDYKGARSVIELASNMPTGTGVLGKIPEAQKVLEELQFKINDRYRTEITFENSQARYREWERNLPFHHEALDHQRDKREDYDTDRERSEEDFAQDRRNEFTYASVLSKILSNPQSDYSSDFIALSLNPKTAPIVKGLISLREQMINADIRIIEDPVTVANLQSDVLSGEAGPSEIIQLVETRGLTPAHTLSFLKDWDNVIDSQKKLEALPSALRAEINRAEGMVYAQVRGGDVVKAMSSGINNLARSYGMEMKLRLLDFVEKNPEATPKEFQVEVQSIFSEIINREAVEDAQMGGAIGEPFVEPALPEPVIPSDAVELLKTNPTATMVRDFDEIYGAGRAKAILDAAGLSITTPPPPTP